MLARQWAERPFVENIVMLHVIGPFRQSGGDLYGHAGFEELVLRVLKRDCARRGPSRRPAFNRSSPASAAPSVDFPAPFGPTMPSISPAWSRKERPVRNVGPKSGAQDACSSVAMTRPGAVLLALIIGATACISWLRACRWAPAGNASRCRCSCDIRRGGASEETGCVEHVVQAAGQRGTDTKRVEPVAMGAKERGRLSLGDDGTLIAQHHFNGSCRECRASALMGQIGVIE